jgi:hypothetical protein
MKSVKFDNLILLFDCEPFTFTTGFKILILLVETGFMYMIFCLFINQLNQLNHELRSCGLISGWIFKILTIILVAQFELCLCIVWIMCCFEQCVNNV